MLTYALRPGPEAVRSADGGQHSARGRGRRLSLQNHGSRDRQKLAVSSPAEGEDVAARATLMFITRRTLPRRTFLRGLGTAVALPFLDAMTPALAQPQAGKAPGAHGVRLRAERHGHAELEPELRGQARRAAADAEAARALQERHPAARQPHAQHRAGAARRRGRPRPLLRVVSHRRAGEEDRSATSRRACRATSSSRIRSASRRASLRSKSGSKTPARRATAIRAIPAPTPTISRGAAKRSRCRRFSIRARSSSACSATARSSHPRLGRAGG